MPGPRTIPANLADVDSDQQDQRGEPRIATRFWGYDRREVDALLAELQQQLDESERAAGAAVAGVSELSGVGERVDEILAAARQTAEVAGLEASERAAALKRESEEAAEQLRREADEHQRTTRTAADEYEVATRAGADQAAAEIEARARVDAEASVAAAEAEAEQILADARAELGRVEASIAELRNRRSAVIAEIDRIRGNLGSMVGAAEQGTAEFLGLPDSDSEDFDEPETRQLEATDRKDDATDDFEEPEYDSDEWPVARRREVTDVDQEEQTIRTEEL
jgi:chromosome segregation ATPase